MVPMFKLQRVTDVIRTDATTPSKTYFLATHTPFRNLRCVDSGVSNLNLRQVDEEKFFVEEILGKRNQHQFLIVQGDNGSGKSHFIRWLKEKCESQVDKEKEAVLFIARSQNTLRGTLEQMLASDVFPPDFRKEKLKGLIEANQHLSAAALQQNIILQFAASANNAYREHSVEGIEERYAKRVYDFLVDRIIQEQLCKKDGPIDRIKSRLNVEDSKNRQDADPRFTPEDFEFDYLAVLNKMKKDGSSRHATALCEDLLDRDKGPGLKIQLVVFLNKYLETVIQTCTNLRSADLKKIFEDLRRELKKSGKALILFIEDITSFTGIDKALMEVLITEHTGTKHNEQFCPMLSVVGVTNAYYKTDIPANIKDRVKGRVFVDQATLSSPSEIAEMTSRYINTILLDEQQLVEWSQGEANENNLPVYQLEDEYAWATYTLDDGRQLPLYPFNADALNNIYSTLEEKTPRRLLLDVVNHVLKLYIARKPSQDFPPRIAAFRGEFQIPSWQDNAYGNDVDRQAGVNGDRIAVLLRVWGDATAKSTVEDGKRLVGGLSEEVFAAFDLQFIDGVAVDSAKNAQTKKNVDPVAPVSSDQIPPQQVNAKYHAMQQELEAWLEGGKLRTYQNLRDDVKNILLDFIDWEMEGVSGVLGNAFFSTDRVSIKDQIGKYNRGFQVKRSKESHNALLALSAWRHLGSQSWNFEGAIEHLTQLHNWLYQVKNEVVSIVVNPPISENEQEWDLPGWALLNEVYVQIFNGKLQPSKLSVMDLYDQIMRPMEDVQVQENRSPAWTDLQTRLKRSSTSIAENHRVVTKFFNRMQVQINQNTEVYFIDAVQVLKLLDEIMKNSWTLDNVTSLTSEDPKGNTIWEKVLSLLLIIRDKAEVALNDENNWIQKQLSDLQEFVTDPKDEKETTILLNKIETFLTEVLQGVNEPYEKADYGLLLDKNKPGYKALSRQSKLLTAALQSKDPYEKIARLSAHPVNSISPYIKLFKKTNDLLEAKFKIFEGKIQKLGDVNDVDIVRNDANELLKTMLSGLTVMGEGDHQC